jgi:hypothetical protein
MAAKWTFDPVNRLFILKPGVRTLDVTADIYSDWKEEVLLTDNIKHPIACRTTAGDPTSDTEALGPVYFMLNRWQIRPDEADHTLTVSGDLFTDPAGLDIFVPTVGGFTVLVTLVLSTLTRVVNTGSGLTAAEQARLILIEQILRNKILVDRVTGKLRIRNDADTSDILEALIFEDVAGLQAYRGQGIERRERLETP